MLVLYNYINDMFDFLQQQQSINFTDYCFHNILELDERPS